MRRTSMAFLILFSLLGLLSGESYGQTAEKYPVKPITCIIPGEAGGDADVNARPLLEKASAMLGKPIMIVNKPGAGQTIGYREIYQAKPDGYTIGLGMLSLVTAKLQGLYPYNYRDFTLMGNFNADYPMIIASTRTKRPFTTIQEVFSYAKSNPGEISLTTTAVGGAYWIAAMLILDSTGLQFNVIPQPGAGAFVVAQVGGGHSDIGIAGGSSAKPHIDAGNLRPLATVGRSRIPKLDYVPTLKEAGHDIIVHSFIGAIGPPKMPKDITEKLVKTFATAANDPEYKNFLVSRFGVPYYMTPADAFNFFEAQEKIYKNVFK